MDQTRTPRNPNGCKEEPRPQAVNYASALTDAPQTLSADVNGCQLEGPYAHGIQELNAGIAHAQSKHDRSIAGKRYGDAEKYRNGIDSMRRSVALLIAANQNPNSAFGSSAYLSPPQPTQQPTSNDQRDQ
ncbi:MAG TPA: hypothetical protein PK735_04030 [Flavobacteriales bacterium]|nr:hypothetical protein [Flavobacteriales bacterium]